MIDMSILIFRVVDGNEIGSFGARMVPKALRMVEVLGILQARKWYLHQEILYY